MTAPLKTDALPQWRLDDLYADREDPRIDRLDGIPLERPVLLQARYSWSLSGKRLLIAPNEPAETPNSYATALGLVLSPSFETKCLVCHGKPGTLGAGKGTFVESHFGKARFFSASIAGCACSRYGCGSMGVIRCGGQLRGLESRVCGDALFRICDRHCGALLRSG